MTKIFTPSELLSYFATKPKYMPKISTSTSKPNYQNITEFQRKLDENILEVLSETFQGIRDGGNVTSRIRVPIWSEQKP